MNNSFALHPCYYCGESKLISVKINEKEVNLLDEEIHAILEQEDKKYYTVFKVVVCKNCDFTSKQDRTLIGAIDSWNMDQERKRFEIFLSFYKSAIGGFTANSEYARQHRINGIQDWAFELAQKSMNRLIHAINYSSIYSAVENDADRERLKLDDLV